MEIIGALEISFFRERIFWVSVLFTGWYENGMGAWYYEFETGSPSSLSMDEGLYSFYAARNSCPSLDTFNGFAKRISEGENALRDIRSHRYSVDYWFSNAKPAFWALCTDSYRHGFIQVHFWGSFGGAGRICVQRRGNIQTFTVILFSLPYHWA